MQNHQNMPEIARNQLLLLAEQVDGARCASALSLDDLAKAVGIDFHTIDTLLSPYLTNSTEHIPTAQHLFDVARYLGLQIKLDPVNEPMVGADLAAAITGQRLHLSMTMEDLSSVLGDTSASTIWALERGEFDQVSCEQLVKIVKSLRMDIQALQQPGAALPVALPSVPVRDDYEENFVNEQLYRFAEILDSYRRQISVSYSSMARDLGMSRGTVEAVLTPRFEKKVDQSRIKMPGLKSLLDVTGYLGHELFVREFGGCPNLDEGNGESLLRVLDSPIFHFGDYMQQRRKDEGFGTTALSKETGYSRDTILRLEQNQYSGARFDTISTILKSLRLELECRPSTLHLRNNLEFYNRPVWAHRSPS